VLLLRARQQADYSSIIKMLLSAIFMQGACRHHHGTINGFNQ
jgi:hypothetical protein